MNAKIERLAALLADAWRNGTTITLPGDADVRAHQRLLREFLHEHLGDGRDLRAFDVWEQSAWDAAPTETRA